jgi:hypothetical protein
MVTAGEAAAAVVVGAEAGVDVAAVIVVVYERHSKINDLHG